MLGVACSYSLKHLVKNLVLPLSTSGNKGADNNGTRCLPSSSRANAQGLRADYLALLANGIAPQIQAEVAEE